MLIEANNLHKIYPGPLHVLKGVDLTIEAGEVVAIVRSVGCREINLTAYFRWSGLSKRRPGDF